MGEIEMGGATLAVDTGTMADPYALTKKSAAELLLYDVQAGAFQLVHVAGQVLARSGEEFFLVDGPRGLRFVPKLQGDFKAGDLVDVVGYAELGGPSPVLREAVARPTGRAVLPLPMELNDQNLLLPENDATRVRIKARLLTTRSERGGAVLELQTGQRHFLARLNANLGETPAWRPGSMLALTGVYAGLGGGLAAGRTVNGFELLVGSVDDVLVLEQPPWWTLRRLLTAVAVLLLVLAGVMFWVFQLRRRVEAQTAVIRESVQQTATLEERTRIARELHDTLEQALAGVSFQLGALAGTMRGLNSEAVQMLERARAMVRHGQDEARRSVRNLRDVTLEESSLAAALERMGRGAAGGFSVKFDMSVRGKAVSLSAQTEGHLLRIGQEALTNALKHAGATRIFVELSFEPDHVQLKISDDGCGFDVAETTPTEAGHFGLLGMQERASKIRANLQIQSVPGKGTVVSVKVPLTIQSSI
jgi:signal transduction histidine kinase